MARYQHDNPGREDDRWQGIIMACLAEGMTDDKVLSYLDEGGDRSQGINMTILVERMTDGKVSLWHTWQRG